MKGSSPCFITSKRTNIGCSILQEIATTVTLLTKQFSLTEEIVADIHVDYVFMNLQAARAT